MNARSVFNRILLSIPAALVAPLLIAAAPVCTSTAGDLNLNGSVPYSELTFSPSQIFDAKFTCAGVTFNSSPFPPSDDVIVFTGINGTATSGFEVTSDEDFLGIADIDAVFTGSSSSNPYLRFTVSDVSNGLNPPTMETVSVSPSPEPGTILLFGTGLLIAGGFIRRRFVSQTLA